MPEVINWSFTVGAVGGPRIAGSAGLQVGAYDKLSITLAAGAEDVDVQLQPATAAGKVDVLVVAATTYDEGLTFSADGGTTAFALAGPLVLIGAGAVELLDAAPRTLRLGNATTEDITLDILIGRDPAP